MRICEPVICVGKLGINNMAELSDGSIGITLCSSFLGFSAHAGFLAGIEAGGVEVRYLAGASSGAMVAGLAAAGISSTDLLELFASREFRHSFLEIGHMLSIPFRRLIGRPTTGLSTGSRALAMVKEIVADRRIEDCPAAQLAIAVTNLTLGRTEIRQAGPLAETLIASCSYPMLVSQQKLGDESFWDGGIANDGPFGHWIGHSQVRTIWMHSVGAPSHRLTEGRLGIRLGLLRSHDAIGAELLRLRKEITKMHGQTLQGWNSPTKRPVLFISESAARENFAIGKEMGLKAAASLAEPAGKI